MVSSQADLTPLTSSVPWFYRRDYTKSTSWRYNPQNRRNHPPKYQNEPRPLKPIAIGPESTKLRSHLLSARMPYGTALCTLEPERIQHVWSYTRKNRSGCSINVLKFIHIQNQKNKHTPLPACLHTGRFRASALDDSDVKPSYLEYIPGLRATRTYPRPWSYQIFIPGHGLRRCLLACIPVDSVLRRSMIVM